MYSESMPIDNIFTKNSFAVNLIQKGQKEGKELWWIFELCRHVSICFLFEVYNPYIKRILILGL